MGKETDVETKIPTKTENGNEQQDHLYITGVSLQATIQTALRGSNEEITTQPSYPFSSLGTPDNLPRLEDQPSYVIMPYDNYQKIKATYGPGNPDLSEFKHLFPRSQKMTMTGIQHYVFRQLGRSPKKSQIREALSIIRGGSQKSFISLIQNLMDTDKSAANSTDIADSTEIGEQEQIQTASNNANESSALENEIDIHSLQDLIFTEIDWSPTPQQVEKAIDEVFGRDNFTTTNTEQKERLVKAVERIILDEEIRSDRQLEKWPSYRLVLVKRFLEASAPNQTKVTLEDSLYAIKVFEQNNGTFTGSVEDLQKIKLIADLTFFNAPIDVTMSPSPTTDGDISIETEGTDNNGAKNIEKLDKNDERVKKAIQEIKNLVAEHLPDSAFVLENKLYYEIYRDYFKLYNVEYDHFSSGHRDNMLKLIAKFIDKRLDKMADKNARTYYRVRKMKERIRKEEFNSMELSAEATAEIKKIAEVIKTFMLFRKTLEFNPAAPTHQDFVEEGLRHRQHVG